MAILTFSDVLNKVGLNPQKVKLIRHALTDKVFRECYVEKKVKEYTSHQKIDFSKGYEYWAVFISDSGTLAKFYGIYRVGDWVPDTPDVIPEGVPECEVKNFQGKAAYFSLDPLDILKEYENKLTIEWGKSARMWHQKGTTEKPIVSLQDKKVFSGFENLILSYDELKEIVENPSIYESWHIALRSVYAIYLIVDKENGKQYVGSAYGEDGLLERWKCYVTTRHGNDKLIKETICNYPERYHYFQFSILQILPKTITPREVIDMETLYKKKLLSYAPFGMNGN